MVVGCSYIPEVEQNGCTLKLPSFHIEEGYSKSQLRAYRKQQMAETRELSGRSRGILKRYFSETSVFDLSVGQPTIAFTVSYHYHILRLFSDEIFSASWDLLKGVSLEDAELRNSLAGTDTRTDHFHKRDRSLTSA